MFDHGKIFYLNANQNLFAKHIFFIILQDQIGVTVDMLKDLSYLDSNRTGIWGWSYGGYLTLMTLMQVFDMQKNDLHWF